MDRHGRVVLVSGAARGQRRAISELAVAAGARVIVGDVLDTVDDVAAVNPEAVHACRLDITDPHSWKRAVQSGVQRFGRLDGLVNNAGVLRRTALEHESAENFERLWRVNCLGAFLGMQAAVPHLRASGQGAIVNTLSTAAVTAWTEHGAYASSKWALRGLTKVAALELAADGIRVNAVLPGPCSHQWSSVTKTRTPRKGSHAPRSDEPGCRPTSPRSSCSCSQIAPRS